MYPVLWNEPLGLDGLSAMAHGKPVVAFETEGIRDWLSDGETGVCIEFGHRHRFRAAVCDLLNDRERLLMLGRRSRQIWEQKFQPEQHLAALVASYEKVKTEAVL